MMGTYDTRGGSPLHDPAADYCPSDEECELEALREQNAAMLEALKATVPLLQGSYILEQIKTAIAAAEQEPDNG